MRASASLSTIQQTLTPEAAAVLRQAIADASRRCHGHTTPLHVAAALLASPSGFLRQACIASHPQSSHNPLQCRALDLCFSVALERLPTVASPDAPPHPPLSNALAAALKRAQAHQRRGCPDHQQQPLLAVKVELDQLVISILDDPGVSRVMREARFSSPAVKSAVEQSRQAAQVPSSSGRNPYLNPRLHDRNPSSVNSRDEYVNRVIEVLSQSRNRNPIIVADSDPEPVLKEVLRRIESGAGGLLFSNAEIVSVEKDLKELAAFISRKRTTMSAGTVLIVDLGDLKWLVDNRSASIDTRETVAEMGKIISRFGASVSVIGTATCETYLRCQVYHPTMEHQWDLQAVSVVAKSPLPATFHRIGTNLSPLKSTCCSQCINNYEQELSELSDRRLPQWMRNPTVLNSAQIKDIDPLLKQKMEELMKKWSDRCRLLHPSNPTSLYANPRLVAGHHFQPNISQPKTLVAQPRSPVRTDLMIGQTNKTQNELQDVDSYKKLLKGLKEKVWWQEDAASALANTISRCKLGNGRKGDIWLLLSGPDRTGKKKMTATLCELVCGNQPVIINLGLRRDGEESGINFRSKTVLDRIAEGIRRNPFSVIMLQDIDEADMLVRGSIKRAMERGRFTDSYGREISLGNIIFVLTVNKQPLSYEDKLSSMANSSWQLKLSVENQKGTKRCRVSFDLNEIADTEEEDKLEKSHNSSDLTVEHDQDNNTSTSGDQLLNSVDECIVFKPVDFTLIRQNIERTISARFRTVFGEKMLVRIESEVGDRILGAWMGSDNQLDSWTEKVLGPTIHKLKSRLFDMPVERVQGGLVARLELDEKCSSEDRRNGGNWMPSRIKVLVLGEEMAD